MKAIGRDNGNNEPTGASTGVLQHLVNQAGTALVYLDLDFNFVAVNEVYAGFCRRAAKDLVGRNHFELYPHAENEAIFRRVRDTGEPASFRDKPFEYPDQPERGTTYWDWTLSPARDPAGRITGLVLSLTETTERRRMEDRLRQSESRFRAIVETTLVGIWAMDRDHRTTYVNPRMADMLGCAAVDMAGRQVEDFILPEDLDAHHARMADRHRGHGGEYEARFRRKDGSTVWTLASATALKTDDGAFDGSFATFTDITERRKAAEERRMLADVLAASTATITIHDLQGRCLFANERALALHGYTREEFLNLNLRDLDTPESAERIGDRMQEIMTRGEASFDAAHRRKDGSEVPMHVSARKTRWGEHDVVLSLAHDISDRKRTEDELRASRRRLDETNERIPGAIYTFIRRTDGAIEIPFMSRSAERLLRRSLGDLTNPAMLFDNVHPDDLAGLWASIDASARGLSPWRHEFRVQHRDGSTSWLLGEANATALPDGGMMWNGVLVDITDRKKIEESLRESENRFRAFLDSTDDLSFVKDETLAYRMVNKAMLRFFGLAPEAILGRDDSAIMPAEAAARCLEGDRAALQAEGVTVQLETVGGRHFESHKFKIPLANGRTGIGAIIRDITERKQAEEELRESEQRFISIFHGSPTAITLTSMEDGRLVDVNPRFTALTGLTREQVIGRTATELGLYADPSDRDRIVADILARGHVEGREVMFCVRPGKTICGMMSVSRISIMGRPHLLAHILDITAKRRVEDALRASEGRLRKVIEILPVGLWFADRDGRILSGNTAGVRIWGAEPHLASLDYGFFKARRLPSGEPVFPDDGALIHTLREGTTTTDEELEIEALDGRTRTILNYTTPLLDANGSIDGAVMVNLDITERKKNEEQRRQLLERLALAARIAELGVWDWDIATGQIVWDPQMFRLYGCEEQPGIRSYEDWASRLHPDDAQRCRQETRDAIEDRGEYETEFRVVHRDGKVRRLRALACVTRDEAGRPLRMTGVNYDITDRTEAEARLNAQLDELRRWHDATLGREARVLQLKREVNELLLRSGKPARYARTAPVEETGP